MKAKMSDITEYKANISLNRGLYICDYISPHIFWFAKISMTFMKREG